MSGGKNQQKNRRDSIKDWRFHLLPPERLPRGSLPHQSTGLARAAVSGGLRKPEVIHADETDRASKWMQIVS